MTTYTVTAGEFIIGGDGPLKDTGYRAINQPTKVKQDPALLLGAELKIAFRALQGPPLGGPTARVSLVQIVQDNIAVQAANGAALHHANVGFGLVQVNDGTGDDGTRIDQDFYDARQTKIINLDPRYAQRRVLATERLVCQDPKKGDVKVGPGIDGERSTGTPSSGYAGERLSGSTFSLAMLRDQPGITIRTTPGNADTAQGNMQFEVAVLFETVGTTPARWAGSISWGFDIVNGVAVTRPIAVVTMDGISPRFQKAVNVWNAAQINDPVTNAPTSLLPLP